MMINCITIYIYTDFLSKIYDFLGYLNFVYLLHLMQNFFIFTFLEFIHKEFLISRY